MWALKEVPPMAMEAPSFSQAYKGPCVRLAFLLALLTSQVGSPWEPCLCGSSIPSQTWLCPGSFWTSCESQDKDLEQHPVGETPGWMWVPGLFSQTSFYDHSQKVIGKHHILHLNLRRITHWSKIELSERPNTLLSVSRGTHSGNGRKQIPKLVLPSGASTVS